MRSSERSAEHVEGDSHCEARRPREGTPEGRKSERMYQLRDRCVILATDLSRFFQNMNLGLALRRFVCPIPTAFNPLQPAIHLLIIRPLVDAGWSSLVARRAHNPKVVGSNPAPATNSIGPRFGAFS